MRTFFVFQNPKIGLMEKKRWAPARPAHRLISCPSIGTPKKIYYINQYQVSKDNYLTESAGV